MATFSYQSDVSYHFSIENIRNAAMESIKDEGNRVTVEELRVRLRDAAGTDGTGQNSSGSGVDE